MQIIEPYWIDEERGLKIYNNRCEDVLPMLDKVDLVLTDPPFGQSYRTNFGLSGDYGAASWRNKPIESDETVEVRDFILSWHKGPAFVFGTWKIPPFPGATGCLIWDKGPASGMGDLSFPWKGSFELIHVYGNGFRGKRDEGILRGHKNHTWENNPNGNFRRFHPTQKPVSLHIALLLKCPLDWVACDPCCGVGTTLIAAKRLNRCAIGIEVEERYCEIAARRLENTPVLPFPEPTASTALQLDAFD